MTAALLRIRDTIKTLGKFQIFGIVCGAYCSIVTALCLVFPRVLAIAVRLL